MATEGWDVWEIEMNGGPTTDCPTCPNYRYEDQVDHYWPASIAAITEYTGKDQVDYVGHSNGCRAALSALNNWSQIGKNNAGYYFNYNTGIYASADLPALPVRRFVGVACPAVLNDTTVYTVLAQALGNQAMNSLSDESHVTLGDYIAGMVPNIPLALKDDILQFAVMKALAGDKISNNLMQFYNDLAIDDSSTLNVSKVNVSELHIVAARPNDFIVPFSDLEAIMSGTTISTANKYNYTELGPVPFLSDHISIKNRRHATIKEALQ